jgi:hypothetical protein
VAAWLISCLLADAALAVPEVAEEKGWSGDITLGVGYTEVESNTVAGNDVIDGADDIIDSIDQKPDSSGSAHPVPAVEIKYTLANRNEIFLGASLEDRLTLDFANQLGWRKQTESAGTFQLGLLFSGVPVEVFEDPYLAGVKREETDRDSSGLRFEWGSVMGSSFDFLVQARDNDIDNELSGTDPSLGCNLDCQQLLDRNGEQYVARLTYTFALPGGQLLRPQLRLRREDRDGDAIARDAWAAQLSYVIMRPGWTLVANALYGESEYDEPNPLYGIRQDADTVALDATLLYDLPVKNKRWQLVAGAFWGESDSKIRFHDNKLSQVFVGVMYNFGNLPEWRR